MLSAVLQIHGLTYAELTREARARLERGHGRSKEVYRSATRQARFQPEDFGLGPASVGAWKEEFALDLPEVVRVVTEEGPVGTTAKAVLRTHDGLELETVCIPMGRGRHSLCVSSQVGCKMGCTFCETGRMGLIRHLSAAEIVGQVLVAQHQLGWSIRNIVFMGMGEALDNADALIQAIRVLNDSSGFAFAQARLTVCTVGRVDGIERLKSEGFRRLNLSVSLNAANDTLRSEMMPVGRKTPLAKLQAALAAYRPRPNFLLGVNYCLMPGINDSLKDAKDVAAFCAPIHRKLVNVIPYNPGNQPLTRAPTQEEVVRFVHWLKAEGLAVRMRITKGRSVMAACGQLGNVELREKRRLGTLK